MKKQFSRLATFLALFAALSYSLHQPHIESLSGDTGSHHCCVCDTVGMTAPAGAPTVRPADRYTNDIPLPTLALIKADKLCIDSPRGPPAV